MARSLFSARFLARLRELVAVHHTIYPRLPPQGIFFEALAESAFLKAGWTRSQVVVTNPNQPQHDMRIGGTKISLKTETGKATKRDVISITKLCTTETGEWTSQALIGHVLRHLSRYEHMLMMRAIWGHDRFSYQVLEVPLELLKRVVTLTVEASGRRSGRRSLSAVLCDDTGCQLYQIRFDGADGKCQIKGLRVDQCKMLLEWEHDVPPLR